MPDSLLADYREMERVRGISPDPWQQRVLDHEGNITIRAGRQVGKSEIISRKAVEFALGHQGVVVLIIAAAQRQSSFLFEKVEARLNAFQQVVLESAGMPEWDKKLSDRQNEEVRSKFEMEHGIFEKAPTRTCMILKNGSRIYSLPAGKTGYFIRCFTIDLLIADEAAYIPECVWNAVIPMLIVSVKRSGFGWIILLSTPFGKGGFFYDSFHRDDFLQIHVSSEDCPRISKIFLNKERARMTKLEYAQEYKGEFIDEFNQLFSTALINKCSTFIKWDFAKERRADCHYYLGVDIARYGADENAFVASQLDPDRKVKIVHVATSERKSIVDTVGRILQLDDTFDFSRIFVDDGGLGGGATDMLIEKLGKKVLGLNNAKRTVDAEGNKGRIMKEDMYSNAQVLMESGRLEMISNLRLQRSLKSMTFEYTMDKNIKIFGSYSHLAEAFVRACWCVNSKALRLFVM